MDEYTVPQLFTNCAKKAVIEQSELGSYCQLKHYVGWIEQETTADQLGHEYNFMKNCETDIYRQ